MRRGRYHYEDAPEYPNDAYQVRGFPTGCYVRGWQTEPDEDTEWSGCENRTGMLVIVMVGDDAMHLVNPDDVSDIDEDEYCHECGQIGCAHDGRERE